MEESKIRKILFNEISIVIGIMVFIASMLSIYYDIRTQLLLIQQDLKVIRMNELVHIQAAITAMEERNAKADEKQTSMQTEITRILTKIEK